MEIKLPPLERILYQKSGTKNTAKQVILPEANIQLNIIRAARSYAVIEENGRQICLASNEQNVPLEFEYAIITNITPNQQRFDDGKINLKRWVKHPDLRDHNSADILASWGDSFYYKEENPDTNTHGLRQPQLAALHSLIGHLKMPSDAAIVVMPTGTGKTETMLSALVAHQCKKLLVTVPSDSLRDQISSKFLGLGLLKTFGVISESAYQPIVGVVKNRFESINELMSFVAECNVVVTTMTWLTTQTDDVQDFVASEFSHIFIDEAHHVKANTWNEFRKKFSKEKVVQFTATPFRNDGKRLDGKIISNFPLRKAQEQGYYKKIEFIPVREFDSTRADAQIANRAVERLRQDLEADYNHILMARCETKVRAESVFKLYQEHVDLNPVIIYSGIQNSKEAYQKILNKEAKIIVCVDMLGEGFDLPELKIAAFHDIRKSLPITLQLAGRFTRTKYDEQLGNASIVANIADINVRTELADLYAIDADWNEILSDASFTRIEEQIEFKDFMSGFKKLSDSDIPFQNIRPKLSTVVYKNKENTWNARNFPAGIAGYDDLDFKFFDVNEEHKILVIILGKKEGVEWVHHNEIYEFKWDIVVAFLDEKNNLLFINSSDNSSLYGDLAKALIGEKAELIRGINVFKSFYNIKRTRLQNVGLRQFMGKNIRFRMMVGSDVGEALSLAERQRGEKAFVMGTGFEYGNPVNVGASYKGRIWTKLAGDLKDYKKWCTQLGDKLVDPSIDSNQILRDTLIPELLTELPRIQPAWIDWDLDMYLDLETKFKFIIDGSNFDMSGVEIRLDEPAVTDGKLSFSLCTVEQSVSFVLELFESNLDGEVFADFKITQIGPDNVEVNFASKKMSGEEFFQTYIPTIWFADGSALTGNDFIQLKHAIGLFPKDKIIAYDWTGVDIAKESQHVNPKVENSIQFKMIEELKAQDFDIIYDDDYSGEIADLVAIKQLPDKIKINLYHLKYAKDGKASNDIQNLYEVCGQAQKSIHWKHKPGKEFVNHLLRRELKSRNGATCSRLEKGTISDLNRLLGVLKNEIPVEFEVFIVQPSISKNSVSDDILTLLGVTENFIQEFANIEVQVIASS